MCLAWPGMASLSAEEREGARGTAKASCSGCLHHHSRASWEQRATNTAGGSGCSQPSSEQDHTQDQRWQISHRQTARTEHPVLSSSSESERCTQSRTLVTTDCLGDASKLEGWQHQRCISGDRTASWNKCPAEMWDVCKEYSKGQEKVKIKLCESPIRS